MSLCNQPNLIPITTCPILEGVAGSVFVCVHVNVGGGSDLVSSLQHLANTISHFIIPAINPRTIRVYQNRASDSPPHLPALCHLINGYAVH